METDGRRVVRWANRSLEPDMFEEEGVPDSQALSAAIKQLMASSGITARNMIASVSGLYSLSRIVVVPTPPGESVTGESVLEVAKELIPLSEEEAYLYWRAVGAGEGGQQVGFQLLAKLLPQGGHKLGAQALYVGLGHGQAKRECSVT